LSAVLYKEMMIMIAVNCCLVVPWCLSGKKFRLNFHFRLILCSCSQLLKTFTVMALTMFFSDWRSFFAAPNDFSWLPLLGQVSQL